MVLVDWNGAGSKLSAAQLRATPPATVISAHGAWMTPNGLIRVPVGDKISMYVPIGTLMGNDLGDDVDTGHIVGKDKMFLHTYAAGQLMPDFTFLHFEGVQVPMSSPSRRRPTLTPSSGPARAPSG